MGSKDIISKHLLKQIAKDMARLLLKLDIDDVEVLDSDNQRIEERRADLVVKAFSGNDSYLLHIEIQNDNQSVMPWRMLRYRTDIRLAHPVLPIQQYMLYIGRQALTMATGIDEPELHYRYHVIDMHNVDYETMLRQDTPEALVIGVLCDFRGQAERDVVRRILRRLYELTADDQAAFRDYFLMLEILSTNRDLKTVIQEEEAMLSQVRYSDLPSYGIGMKEGMKEGMQQAEALILLKQLKLKFGTVSDELHQRIQATDAETLLRWLERILSADSIDDVLQ